MKGVKELKARLGSIGNIKKVTSTMELVATAKMKKLQERALASRPYADAIRAMMAQVAAHAPADVSPLLEVPEKVERECIVVVAGTKGLCGAFNANVLRHATKLIEERMNAGVEVSVFAVGSRSELFFRKIKADVVGAYEGKLETADYRSVAMVMRDLADAFLEGTYQRVSLVYTSLESAVRFTPTSQQLLPLASLPVADEGEAEAAAELDYIMELSPEVILSRLIPKSLEMTLFSAVLESLASEFAARRIAMKNATDSASDMIDDLTREYNKARQTGITAELLEITAGAEALKG